MKEKSNHQTQFRLLARSIFFALVLSGLVILPSSVNLTCGSEERTFVGFRQGEDSESIPEGWEHVTYPGRAKNEVSLLKEGERTVLHVQSMGSASALVNRLDTDIREFPILVWCWKINRVVGMAIENQKDRNDSAARIRVIFGAGAEKARPVPPQVEELLKSLGYKKTPTEPWGNKIDYIWGNRLSPGTSLDYPGSRNHKVIVIESGEEKANQWIWEKRNLIEDYELLFGAAPPGLAGIAVLTDTDNTNEGIEAWYSSIVLMAP
jgi:hypothetical protein